MGKVTNDEQPRKAPAMSVAFVVASAGMLVSRPQASKVVLNDTQLPVFMGPTDRRAVQFAYMLAQLVVEPRS